MAVQVASSPTPRKVARTKKTLDHLEVHAKMGGGNIVKHVYEPRYIEGVGETEKAVHFNADGKSQGGEHIIDHLRKHAGLPERDESSAEERDGVEHLEDEEE